MNASQLLNHFDRICEAPDAIPRLRRFILDLAVRGKLVKQDRTDRSTSELLEHLRRTRLYSWRPITEDEIPFPLVSNWKFLRLGQCLHMINGRAFKLSDWKSSGLPIVRIQNLNNDSAPFNYCDEVQLQEQHVINSGSLLISWSGTPGTSFGAFIWNKGKAALNQHIFKCIQVADIYLHRFLRIAINGRLDEMISKAHGGVGLQHITKARLENLVLPLPPVEEQHRIAAKVDELMGLCDQLEESQKERESRRDRLTAASLHGLNNGNDDDSIRNSTSFFIQHLPRLATRKEHIDQLRKTILNLAIRGKLLPQDPNEKTCTGYPRADKSGNEVPFLIPTSWVWVSVRDIADSRLGKMLDKAKNKGIMRRYLRNLNVRWFDFDLSDILNMRFEDDELEQFSLRTGDVLICEGGEPGRAAVWDEREHDIYFQKAIHRVRFSGSVNPHYFTNVLRESAISGRLNQYFTGVGIKHLTGKGLSSFIFPLPPLAEQNRIMAKVNELMALCDQLELQLSKAQGEIRRLLEGILRNALRENSGEST